MILARKHGAKNLEMVVGPDAGILIVIDEFRKLLHAAGSHGDYEEAQLWLSDSGLDRTVKFKAPERSKKTK